MPDGGEYGVSLIWTTSEAFTSEWTTSIAGEVHTGFWVGCKVGAETWSFWILAGVDENGAAVEVVIPCSTGIGMFEQPAENNNKRMTRFSQEVRKLRLSIACRPQANWIGFY